MAMGERLDMGQWSHRPLDQIPTSYLEWFIQFNFTQRRGVYRNKSIVQAELIRRELASKAEKETKDMALTLKDTGSPFELAPAGAHVARCFCIVDLGTQEVDFSGSIEQKQQILFGWELIHEKKSDGSPFLIYQRYSGSLAPKSNLRKVLESWRGRPFTEEDLQGFNIAKVLGQPCQLSLIHKEVSGKAYANISTVMGVPKGIPVPDAVTVNQWLDLDPPLYDADCFAELSEKLQETIKKSPEWQALQNPAIAPNVVAVDIVAQDDDTPF
jgi:hypothetical protein